MPIGFFRHFKKLNSNQPRFLSDIVNASKSRVSKKNRREWLSDIWIPSKKSFLIVFFVALSFGVVAHIDILSFSFFSQKCGSIYNFFLKQELLQIKGSDLIAIHAGIGAILTGLAFFVAAKMGNKSDPYEGQVLLYKSGFFPLLTLETLVFLFFSWGTVNFLALIPIVVVGLFTVFSVGRVIRVLLRETDMEKAKEAMLFQVIEKIGEISDLEIEKRSGNNHLYSRYENNNSIKFGYFDFSGKTEKFIEFKRFGSGIIKDIDLIKLEELENKITSFRDKEILVGEGTTQDKKPLKTIDATSVFYPIFLERINDQEGILLAKINPEIVKNIGKREIERCLEKIFITENQEDLELYVRTNISKLKDGYLKAARSGENGELEKILRLYLKIAEKFFDTLDQYGGQFSADQAKKERSAFPHQELKPFGWLKDDLREIYECGLTVNDRKVVSLTAYFPIAIAKGSILRKDHLLFQEFLFFPVWGYSFVGKFRQQGNNDLADFLLDRIWRHLDELSWIHLEGALKKNKLEVSEFSSYSIQFLLVFQSLLKSSLDKRNYKDFELFVQKTNKLFDGFRHEYSDGIKEVSEDFEKKRKQMFFGIGSWLLELYKHKEITELKPYLDIILSQFEGDIINTTDIFLESHDFDVEDFWGWGGWEMDGHEGETVCIQFLEKMECFFVIVALRYLSRKTDSEIEGIILPTNRDFAFLAEGSRALLLTIKDIENNPDPWKDKHLLDDSAIQKTQALKNLLETARRTQEENDLQRKRETRISQDVVKQFKDALLEDYKKSDSIKRLFESVKRFTDQSKESYTGKITKWGVNTLFDKAAFFDKSIPWHVSFIGIEHAFDFGGSIAKGEDIEIFSQMANSCEQISFDLLYEKIEEIGPKNALILATDQMLSYDVFEKSNRYIQKWRNDYPTDGLLEQTDGVLKYENSYVPIFYFSSLYPQREIILLDRRKMGKVVQFSPLSSKDDTGLQKGIFFIDVQEFLQGSDLVKDFILQKPQWLVEYGTEDKQEAHLQENVLIQVFERYEYQPGKDFKGYKFINIPNR